MYIHRKKRTGPPYHFRTKPAPPPAGGDQRVLGEAGAESQPGRNQQHRGPPPAAGQTPGLERRHRAGGDADDLPGGNYPLPADSAANRYRGETA